MNARQPALVGKTANHLRFTAYERRSVPSAIAFRCRDIEALALTDAPVDLAYEIDADEMERPPRCSSSSEKLWSASIRELAPAAALIEDLFEHADEIIASRVSTRASPMRSRFTPSWRA